MNNQEVKMPLWIAVLININIVVGNAFFIGAPQVVQASGMLAPLAWGLCGIFLLPMVFVFSKLSRMYPTAGGIYIYSLKHLGKFWGFASGWGYYIGTAAANAFVLHTFCSMLQSVEPTNINLDLIFIAIFTLLNLLNIEFLQNIQIGLTIIKVIPFVLILAALPALFSGQNILNATPNFAGFFGAIPIALFAYVGFEACCSISDKIKDGEKNASKVILISFGLIIFIYTIMQFFLLGIHGSQTINPFLEILPKLTTNFFIINWGNNLINFAILTSFIAGFYGMFYYNNWNLYAIASENSIIFSRHLVKLNKNQSPYICVIIQGLLVALFLTITTNSDHLVTMSDFATTLAYLLSTISFIVVFKKFYGYLAVATGFVFCAFFVYHLAIGGFGYLVPFFAIFLSGFVGYKIQAYSSMP